LANSFLICGLFEKLVAISVSIYKEVMALERKPKTLFVFAILILILIDSSFASRKKIPVKAEAAKNLQQLLDETQELHSALFKQKDPKIATQLEAVQFAISQTLGKVHTAGPQAPHLQRILMTAKKHFKAAEISEGEKRKLSLKDAFRQIVLIAQSYAVGDKYVIYFCPRDRSVWLQKKGRAQNPIHPKTLPRCGRIARQQTPFLFLDKEKPYIETLLWKTTMDKCKMGNTPGACLEFFNGLRILVGDLNTVSSKCLTSIGSMGTVQSSVWESLRLIVQIAWGTEPPATNYEKLGWLDNSTLSIFCRLKKLITERGLYPKEQWAAFREETLMGLPKAKEIGRSVAWGKSLLSVSCHSF
jgi:hypothetical protein